jgi:hypothetical protein
MSTRLSVDLMFLALIGAIAAWVARAPVDPPARAAYLCEPVIVAADAAAYLQAAVVDEGNTIAPTPAWRPDPGRVCMRLVIGLTDTRAY